MPRFPRIVLALAALAASHALCAETDPDRGRALYEMRCLGCHTESVHARKQRVASDFPAVRAWVARWNETLDTRWSADEIDDVARYLNATYYRYSCPPTVCKVVSLMQIKGAGPSAPYF